MSIGIRSSGHFRCNLGERPKSKLPWETYPAKLISFELLWLPSAEASLVDKVGEFLLHEFFNLLNGFLKASLAGACDMEIQGWILHGISHIRRVEDLGVVSYRSSSHAFVGII